MKMAELFSLKVHPFTRKFVYVSFSTFFQQKLDRYAKDGTKFEVFQDVCACTLDIILKCAFSYDVDVQRQG